MTEAHMAGVRAFRAGKLITANPYSEMSAEWKDWNDGYISAENSR